MYNIYKTKNMNTVPSKKYSLNTSKLKYINSANRSEVLNRNTDHFHISRIF